ncbi:MAG: hypothetical protein L0332_29305 [Chloroflexi bacterium]|nr:hypothetical protein [Chloroflexota bacterium]MCI0578946.1 hypothetical protein [Chloroflexota bacterium]MCI0646883.1 hypothetical protein [Chloroflexota bacterium]MCI0730799.1 hypothetical protein [Chloroflexota bacterium]
MKRLLLLLSLSLIGLLVACNGGDGEETPEVTTPGPAGSTPTVQGYPALPTPTAPLPGEYPPPQPEAVQPTAYPAGSLFWIVRAAGQQCADPTYPTLQSAIDALEQAGVEVLQSEEVSLAVCEACDCPTSQHYRIQIDANDLDAAAGLGWRRE